MGYELCYIIGDEKTVNNDTKITGSFSQTSWYSDLSISILANTYFLPDFLK